MLLGATHIFEHLLIFIFQFSVLCGTTITVVDTRSSQNLSKAFSEASTSLERALATAKRWNRQAKGVETKQQNSVVEPAILLNGWFLFSILSQIYQSLDFRSTASDNFRYHWRKAAIRVLQPGHIRCYLHSRSNKSFILRHIDVADSMRESKAFHKTHFVLRVCQI